MESIRADDAGRTRLLLDSDPELKARINDPVGPFDSPALTSASRAMIDVLLAAGADVNARSQWWAGGFGFLHTANPELAEYAIQRGAVVDAHAAARLGRLDAYASSSMAILKACTPVAATARLPAFRPYGGDRRLFARSRRGH